MRRFRWDPRKNEALKAERGIGFERIVLAVADGDVLDVLRHPNEARYPNQTVLVVAVEGYAYLVPYVVVEPDGYFLKTVIPSRRATREYLRRKNQMKKIDAFEKEIIEAYESGILQSTMPSKSELRALRDAARATSTKDRRVNIRLSAPHLSDLRARALEEGVPYQTLIASVLHKFVAGRLVERPARLTLRPTRPVRKRAAAG